MVKRIAFIMMVATLLATGCSVKKKLIGRWKVVEFKEDRHAIFTDSTIFVFDPEGFIFFNKGKAARGEWVLKQAKDELEISIYGRVLHHDIRIIGEYDLDGGRLKVLSKKDKKKVLIELEKIE